MQDIRRQLSIALRWLPLVVIGALAAGALAYGLTSGQPKVYQATARLIVDPGPNPTFQELSVAGDYVGLYASHVDSRGVAQDVMQKTGQSESVEDFLKRISTTTSSEDLALEIEVRADDPEAARVIALAYGDKMRELSRELVVTDEARRAEDAIKATEQAITFHRNRLNTLIQKPNKTRRDRNDIQILFTQISSLQASLLAYQPSARAFISNRLDWFERPIAPDAPVEPRPMLWTLLALVAGGMLAMATAFVIEFLRNKVRDEHDMEVSTGVPALGMIPEKRGDIRRGDPSRLALLRYPASKVADAYRDLHVRITLANGTARSLLVASPDSGDAKSVVAANLALAYAESGVNVILVDGDHRSPRLHSFFGVPNDRGLSSLSIHPGAPLGQVTFATAHPRLRLMPAGPPSLKAGDPMATPQGPGLMDRMLQSADMVILDSPAMSTSLDAAMLATRAQESLLVVPVGSRGEAAAEAARTLDSADANLVGAVLYRKVRGSHKGAAVSSAVALPSGQPAVQNDPVPASRPPVIIYIVVNILYRILGGPHPHAAESQKATPVSGRSVATNPPPSPAQLTPPRAPHEATASSARTSSGAPESGPKRTPVTIPVAPTPGNLDQPSPGPYAGGFVPAGANPPSAKGR